MADECLNTVKLCQTMAVCLTTETIIFNVNMVHLVEVQCFLTVPAILIQVKPG